MRIPDELDATTGPVDPVLSELVDELTEKIRRQQPINVDEYRRTYPQFVAQIERILPTLKAMAGLKDSEQQRATEASVEQIEAIDRYTIREQIGEGGMGTVYVAEQLEPVRRKVALKIIRAGMASKEIVARFEAERQALAMMDHAHIARVLDGGTTTNGQPYFVMELVQGLPITEYADAHRMSVCERLDLFTKICQAVQHAHRKGIIHRDLKPSNILVAEIDNDAVPKVIDFGLAKALNQPLTDGTLYTGFSQMMGTPMYMSPEQVAMGVIDVDTRCDVYALGVVLYELLVGQPPFDRAVFRSGGFDEVRRTIREVEPSRPSSAVSTMVAKRQTTVAEQRHVDSRKLSDSLRGELDWIVLKSLEKDRRRRYESASALADDVQRYLDDRPVQACPPSTSYRLRKFARRHRSMISTAALMFMTMCAGTVVATWQAIRAGAAEQAANEKQEVAERNLEAAMDAMEQMLANVGNPDLAEIPKLQEIRAKILQDALTFYERFKADSGSSPGVNQRAARLYKELGEFAQANRPESQDVINAFAAGLKLADALVLQFPKRNDFRELQADMNLACADYWWMPKSIATQEDYARAMDHFESAKDGYAQLCLANPGDERYRELRGSTFARMAMLCLYRSSSDPLVKQYLQRATDLGYSDHVVLAKIAEVNEPKQAAKHWRSAVAEYRSDRNAGLKPGDRALWWAGSAIDSLSAEEADWLRQESVLSSCQQFNDFPTHRQYWRRFVSDSLGYQRYLMEPERVAEVLTKADLLIQSHPAFHSVRAMVLDEWHDRDDQWRWINESIRRYPTQADYYRVRAEILEDRGELGSALDDLNRVLNLNKHHSYGYLRRGKLHIKRGEYQNAVDDLTTVFEMSGRADGSVLVHRAEANIRLGNHAQALSDLNDAIDQDADHLSALTAIGPTVATCSDPDFRNGILRLADRAVELNERSASSIVMRITLLVHLNQHERALGDILATLADSSADDGYHLYYRAALLALKLGDRTRYQQVCEEFVDKVDRTDKEQPMAFATWTAALARGALTDYHKAVELAEAVVQIDPQNGYLLAAIQMRARHYRQASATLEEMKQADSTDTMSVAYKLVFQAMTQHHLGQRALARESLSKACEMANEVLDDQTNPPSWTRILTMELLRSEAESLVLEAR